MIDLAAEPCFLKLDVASHVPIGTAARSTYPAIQRRKKRCL